MLWNNAYETGIGIVDEQHKELFRQIDILVENKEPNAVPKVIDFLGQYVVKHFSTEEGLQRKSSYPDFVEHKKKHVAFVDAFTRLKTEYQESGQNNLILMKLTRVALDWLKQHIRVEDKKFASHYLSVFPNDAKAGKAAGLGLATATVPAGGGKGTINPVKGAAGGTAGSAAATRSAKLAGKTPGTLPPSPPRARTARRQPSPLLKGVGGESGPYAKPAILGEKRSHSMPAAARSTPGTTRPPRTAAKPGESSVAARSDKASAGLDLKKAPSDARKTGGVLKLGAARPTAGVTPAGPAKRGGAAERAETATPVPFKKPALPGKPAASPAGPAGKPAPGASDGPFQFSTATRRSNPPPAGLPPKPATPIRTGKVAPAPVKKEPPKPLDQGKSHIAGVEKKPASERFSFSGISPSSKSASGQTPKLPAATGSPQTRQPARTSRISGGRTAQATPARRTSPPAKQETASPTAKPRSPAATARAIPLTPAEQAAAKMPQPVGETTKSRVAGTTARAPKQPVLPSAATKRGRTPLANDLLGKLKRKP